jgi:hypothetical protein
LRQWAAEQGRALCPLADAMDTGADVATLCNPQWLAGCTEQNRPQTCARACLRSQAAKDCLAAVMAEPTALGRVRLLAAFARDHGWAGPCEAATQLEQADETAQSAREASDLAAASRPRWSTVHFAAPAVDGEIDPSIIARTMRGSLGDLQECYAVARRHKPGLQGRIGVRWKITSAGRVRDAEISYDEVANKGVRQCLLARLRALSFPNPERAVVEVEMPFSFSPPPDGQP